jgi:hypothetical protein
MRLVEVRYVHRPIGVGCSNAGYLSFIDLILGSVYKYSYHNGEDKTNATNEVAHMT